MDSSYSFDPWIPVVSEVLFSTYYSSHSLFCLDDLIVILMVSIIWHLPNIYLCATLCWDFHLGFLTWQPTVILNSAYSKQNLTPPTNPLCLHPNPSKKKKKGLLFLFSISVQCTSTYLIINPWFLFLTYIYQQVLIIYVLKISSFPPYQHLLDSSPFHHPNQSTCLHPCQLHIHSPACC